jgi:2-polyprenyl-3-methyl-5-hydroxy-6-metoxy-1,4-benzoquinol methylase
MNIEEKAKLKELYRILERMNIAEVQDYLPVLADVLGQSSDFNVLKTLLESNQWPEAVDPNLICDLESETDKISRAEGMLELIVEKKLKDLAFLDFGCGEGHVAYQALTQEPKISVGYDIKEDAHWNSFGRNDKLIFTNNISIVKQYAPYDVIILYDVIDHVEENEITDLLTAVASVLSSQGTVYLRTHPFCSRHATHLYHKINKAFMHLIFTESELQEMNYNTPVSANVVYPIAQYKMYIADAGLQITHNNILREKVESFFIDNPLIKQRIRSHYPNSKDTNIAAGGFPVFQCEQQFIDYVLKKS